MAGLKRCFRCMEAQGFPFRESGNWQMFRANGRSSRRRALIVHPGGRMMGVITTSEQLSKTPGDQAAAFQKLIRGRVLPSGGGSTAAFNTNKGQTRAYPL